MAHYKVTLEDTKHITTMEFYGKDFPLHPEEFSQFESLWQEDYARFLLQKDIGLLTIYYAKEDISLLWESNYNSIHAIYQHLNHQENHLNQYRHLLQAVMLVCYQQCWACRSSLAHLH